MRRGLPLWPTLTVALALPVLVGLGVWQLQRAAWKDALLADLAANSRRPLAVIGSGDDPGRFQFRRVAVELGCSPPPPTVQAGRNRAGQSGYAVLVRCRRVGPAGQGDADLFLNIGWGPRPDSWKAAAGAWPPATIHRAEGVLVQRDGDPQWMLVATAASPPLAPSAPPSVATIPNNHRAYAAQWFGFAGLLLIFYRLFLGRWKRAGIEPGARPH